MWLFRNARQQILSRGVVILTIVLIAASSRSLLSQGKQAAAGGEKARKYVNKIPYDVFFDNPLQVVNSNKGNVATPAETSTAKASEPQPANASTQSSTPAGKGGITWQEMLPMEELQREVKSIRNNLTNSMTNQGQFNNNFKEIGYDGSEMAALGGIAQEHGESIGWKDKAQFVRDFGAQINQASVGLGKDNFEKTKAAFQKLTSVLDGSIPPDAGDIPATRPFSETASRKGLMRRIDRAKKWLKEDVNTEAKFKSMSSQIEHEAAILAAMATVITTEGYSDRDNDDYQQFAKTLIDGAKEAVNATKEESFDRFKQAVDKVNKSCTDCHGVYGNG